MARVLFENITKVFDGKITAVSNFTLDVADGRFVVIVGPSGCGKTTTLRLAAGLEKADKGNIYIDDTLVNDLSPKDRDIAMVFQNYALYPHMTAEQNMAFALKMRKLPKQQIKKSVKDTAKLLGIEQLLNRKPRALSGGQRQRVALGKAIVRNPKAFLLDEPLSNLDAGMRLAMRAELKTLHKKLASTIIYVTHDQTEAMTLGEQLCVMKDGVIQQIASPVQVYEQPVNKFVAGFFGTPPMNFFAGLLTFKNDSACFLTGRELIELPKSLNNQIYDYRDKEILLGVRPENISMSNFAGQENNAISATVDTIEPVGSRTDIYFNLADSGKYIASVIKSPQFDLTNPVKMYIDSKKIHLFETGPAGKNITFLSEKM